MLTKPKNPTSGLPFYDRLEDQQRFDPNVIKAKTALCAPVNSVPAFQLCLDEKVETISWEAKNHCTGDVKEIFAGELIVECVETKDDSIMTYVSFYGDAIKDFILPCGDWYICLEINGRICYSEEFGLKVICGLERPGIVVTECNESKSCCPVFPEASRPRCYYRTVNGVFWFYGWSFFLNQQIVTAGGTNLVWSHQLFDNTSGAQFPFTGGGGPTQPFAFNFNITNATVLRYEASVTYDILCDDGTIHSITLSWSCIVNLGLALPNWQFDFIDYDCVDSDSGIILDLTPSDSLQCDLETETTEVMVNGTYEPLQLPLTVPSSGAVIRRCVKSVCCDTERCIEYFITFDSGDACGSVELIEI